MTRPAVAAAARAIPRLPGLEHSLAFLADPYRFISRACAMLGSDVIEARLMLQPTLCLVGPEAARLFYDQSLFVRAGAAPEPVRATLFGKGAVQALDGDVHRVRKAFFLRATAPPRVAQLAQAAQAGWPRHAPEWSAGEPFSLYRATQPWLAEAVCAWAGVPVPPAELPLRTAQLVALFDQAASGALAHLRARRARKHAERWLCELVQRARGGEAVFVDGSIAAEAAQLRDGTGALLPPRIAAVELLNVLRPCVAVSVYLVLAAHALHLHPRWRAPLAEGDTAATHAFAQEVRRWYPFFPAVAARTVRDFEWQGLRLPAGRRAMLDLHGTNHDPRSWEAPEVFDPGRFLGRQPTAFDLVPQGGARADDHHRCPGEDVVLALLALFLGLLARSDYSLPPQQLDLRMDRMPAVPASEWLVTHWWPA